MRVLEIEKKEGESTRKHRQMWFRFSTLCTNTNVNDEKHFNHSSRIRGKEFFSIKKTLDRKFVSKSPEN